ncbi:DUF5677 domain-containing protein [Agreia sp. Leaf283]|uniref:DUF5677 domain-containing protein n=1 Tax=Agreia sp. Leaf283 TaxID=1736321 RepID=UPI000701C68C|nr:DUF5677 domain-containing protein [Agreia sp. Leaf283]KQP55883.1 hypothetical protein ASF51_12115 [Agreia sp. Leaf283]
MPSTIDYARELDRLIELWDKHRQWNVPVARHGVNVALLNAYVAHSVNLARAVRVLDGVGLTFESMSLVRSTMEATVTASWLALFPDKTPDFTFVSAQEKKKTLDQIVKHGLADGGPGLEQTTRFLEGFGGKAVDPEGRWLKSRFESIRGGDQLYLTYRILCSWDHATNSLADQYVEKVAEDEANPWGLVLLDQAASRESWLGVQSALILRAQMAADMVLTKPRHRTQLRNFARRFGVADSIEPM